MHFLRAATASQIVTIGPIVAAADGTTAYTSALANTDIKLWKEGGTSLGNKNSGGSTHISGGVHYCTLDATDSNTIGKFEIYTFVTSQFSTKDTYQVLAANVYDSLMLGAGSDLLDVSVIQFAGDATAATNAYRAFNGLIVAQAVTGTLSAAAFTTNLSSATDHFYEGRDFIFVTGALAGQGGNINTYTGSSKLINCSAMTGSPSNLDYFVIT